MKKNFKPVSLAILVLILATLACSAVEAPTPTLVPTRTLVFSSMTPISTSTSTPLPIPTSTPSAKGDAVINGNMEITLLDVYRHDKIVTGGSYYYTAKPGYIILDLFVRLRNLGSSDASVKWKEIYINDDGGDSWYPGFAGKMLAKKSEKINPFDIPTDIEVNGDDLVQFSDSVYLRLIYMLEDKPSQIIQFGIADSPLIQFAFTK